ncbi:hypothetical protein SMITH_439 [Smithella sp. ME-1]|uniref:Uncharacterized protein n=1 Tax=hydrocarbon metagenome TaxID=938273 RepID=A0A0W8FLB3_9ZZZZ|nr:hypothetical protein SMITH_439 [Smithella sp. ME-1]
MLISEQEQCVFIFVIVRLNMEIVLYCCHGNSFITVNETPVPGE